MHWLFRSFLTTPKAKSLKSLGRSVVCLLVHLRNESRVPLSVRLPPIFPCFSASGPRQLLPPDAKLHRSQGAGATRPLDHRGIYRVTAGWLVSMVVDRLPRPGVLVKVVGVDCCLVRWLLLRCSAMCARTMDHEGRKDLQTPPMIYNANKRLEASFGGINDNACN